MESKRIHLLVDKFLSGTATASEKEELNQWYQDAYQEDVEWLHNDIDEEKIMEQRLLTKLQNHIEQQDSKPPESKFRIFRIPRTLRIATAAACIIFGIFTIYKTTSQQDPDTSFLAPADQTENTFVLLPDSSKVILRAGSKLSYQYTDTLREVFLTGSGFFEVRKNKQRPFLVHTEDITTRVLGTSFSVEVGSDSHVKVAVKTGKVAVQNKLQNTLAILTPNQAVNYDKERNSLQRIAIVPEEQLSWVNIDMRFTEVPFGRLAAALTRRYNTEIVFQNEQLKNCLLTGYFEGTESLAEVLDILAKTAGAAVTFEKNKMVLTGAGCPKQNL